MRSATEPSVEELREESERTREALAATVGELRNKVGDTASEIKTMVSPSHIKEEIRTYIRDERESLVRSVQRKVRENPLQAAAIGAAVVYPAWGILRAIPMPLMLIGAGLFLTTKRGQETALDVKARVDRVIDQGTERAADLAGSIQSDLQDRADGARYALHDARDAVSEHLSAMSDSARNAAQSVADRARSFASKVSGAATEAKASASDMFQGSQTAGNSGMQSGARSGEALLDFAKANPLLVAGIGAAVGAFIAASIPPSDAEDKLFGAGSDAVKDKARKAAAEGIEKAGDVVSKAAGSMANAAAQEGLDATSVQNAMDNLADKARTAADRSLDTALGARSEKQQPQGQRHE